MNKLTLDDLRRQYSDRPQPAEIEKLNVTPVPLEPETTSAVEVEPAFSRERMANTPIVGFLVFAGVAMFAGFAVLVNTELQNQEPTKDILGVADVQKDVDNKLTNTKNVAPEDMDIKTVIREIHNLLTDEDSSNIELPEEDVVVDEDEQKLEEVVPTTKVKVLDITGGYVNLRRDPLLGAFSRAASGTEFELVSETTVGDYTWVEVRYDETSTCWIRGDLVEKL